MQECLVHAWQDVRGLRDPGRFEAWLQRLLVNACYDESRRRRSPAGSLTSGRVRHTATLLRDGRVLVIGGRSVDHEPSTSSGSADVESGVGDLGPEPDRSACYDTATRPRSSPMAGCSCSAAATWTTRRSPPRKSGSRVSGTFSPTGSLRLARTDHTATMLPDGR